MGFYQVFTILGLTEFFNKKVPINMRSIGNSLLYLGMSLASYLSSAMVSIVHSVIARGGRQSWLTDDIDASKLDNFCYFIAGLSTLNFIFFLWCARRYHCRNMWKNWLWTFVAHYTLITNIQFDLFQNFMFIVTCCKGKHNHELQIVQNFMFVQSCK